MTRLFCNEFDQVAAARPRHVAIEQDGWRRCSYAELQSMSREIEMQIREAGVGRQSVVVIEIEKSIEYIASLIAVWRAGCVAVPLPGVIPEAARGDLRRRCGAVATLRHDSTSSSGLQVDLQGDGKIFHAEKRGDRRDRSDDLAYLFFTSGSTGVPKGVLLSHCGLVPVLSDQIVKFQMGHHTRSLFYLSTCFDASLSDLGTALLCGGTLVIESDIQSLSVASLMCRIGERQITYADLPPAILSRVAKLELELPPTLSTVVVGGEVCSSSAIDWFSSRLDLYNVYGPTEATICTSVQRCRPGESPSLGAAIAGMRYRVESIDEADPTEGELWISGPGLAIGYVDDSELTEQKFVIRSGTRWYRTGDHVRVDARGQVFFLGRLDQQFKLLGQLVEPEQIRVCLLNQDSVGDAVVIPVRNQHRKVVSIAAVVAVNDGCDLSGDVLRERLAQSLPKWMVPATIKIVDSIPKTAAGKTDLAKAGTLVNDERRSNDRLVDGPEICALHATALHRIWAQVLGHGNFGWDDSLGSCGGSSLDAMEILAAARAQGLPVDLSDLQCKSLRECLSGCGGQVAMSTDELGQLIAATEPCPQRTAQTSVSAAERSILLTGSTGFLGTWVLENLMKLAPDIRVTCLVRGRDPDHGRSRIELARRRYLGPGPRSLGTGNVEVICGDIGQANLGADDSQWSRLSDQITDVFHCAAQVHLLKDLNAMRRVNFDSMLAIASLASQGRPKSIRYASTLSVFAATDREESCYFETDRLDQPANVFGGYGQTKWAAEKLLWSIDQDPLATVFRFGLLTGDTERCVGPRHDQLAMTTRGLAILGQYPAGTESLCFDVTPVDQAARGAVRLMLEDHIGAFHLCGPTSVSLDRWIEAMRRSGIDLDPVEPQVFWRSARQFQDDSASDPQQVRDVAAATLALRYRATLQTPAEYGTGLGDLSDRSFDLFLATKTRFDASRTDGILQAFDEQVRKADDALLRRMVRVMLNSVMGVVA